MLTDAKRRANAKSEKKNVVRIVMKLSKGTDADIIEKLQSLDNRQGYLKELIRKDLKAGKKNEESVSATGLSEEDKE